MADLEARENPYNVRQASRIYLLPNLMTAGNLFCGFVAVIKCIQARMATGGEYAEHTPSDLYTQAVWFILGAVLFDSLDGRLARMGGRESLFGAEFDSLADVVSFGVAPALMVFFLILSPDFQGIEWFRQIGWLVGFVYLLCASMRLARFNVITNPLLNRAQKESSKDFVGLPVPAAAGTVVSLVLFLLRLANNNRDLGRWAIILPFLMVLIAFLMMTTIRYPSFKQVDWQTRTRLRTFVLIFILIGGVMEFQEIALLWIFLGYIFYGLFGHWRRIQRARKMRSALSIKM
ncbi:MAG TPA: CDP-diacylglycerol--serine O-phosphatidyltransferase [Opitutaceae bacterium]|nr:CDP-diacylglycerol--serine O-phosphatidyltransferase [Opitutaceae bacterium]